MLRRARQRLLNLTGEFPGHIVLLQAELSELPFRPGSFQTIVCLNVLHQFADAAALTKQLKNTSKQRGASLSNQPGQEQSFARRPLPECSACDG